RPRTGRSRPRSMPSCARPWPWPRRRRRRRSTRSSTTCSPSCRGTSSSSAQRSAGAHGQRGTERTGPGASSHARARSGARSHENSGTGTGTEESSGDRGRRPSMSQMNMVQAINDALRLEMRRDSRVVVLGEDVGKVGGVFRVTQGLFDEFGDDRVIDTPLSEGGIIGTAIGMALYGLVPVPEIQFADFIFPAYDQIVSELAKYRYRSGGEYPANLVIRTPVGGGIRGGHYHSQSPEAQFVHVAGLKVVCPSNPADAKGLLLASIRDPDPVLFFEPKRIY